MIVDSETQTINDLIWALTSPNLLLSPPDCLTGGIVSETFTRQILDKVDNSKHFSSNANKLGHYFEELIGYAIDNNPHFSLIAKNLGVFEDKQQLGEFDFIFTHQNISHHWEVAVKFYLYHPATQLWYGPNARDRFDKKLDKLFRLQLNLSRIPSAKQLLQDKFNLSLPLKSDALVKGYLFYPYGDTVQQRTQHSWLNPEHLQGWWCYQRELHIKLASVEADHRWAILPKLRWLSQASLVKNNTAFNAGQLLKELSEFTSPPLLVELKNIDNTWQEVSRGFVVPDTWPNQS